MPADGDRPRHRRRLRPDAARRRHRASSRVDPGVVARWRERTAVGTDRRRGRLVARRARPRLPAGFDAVVASTIPVGSGLSSSAAFEVAITLAARDASPTSRSQAARSRSSRRRSSTVATPACRAVSWTRWRRCSAATGHALLLDCRTLDGRAGRVCRRAIAVVVVHSGLPRRLETSAYAARRAACESAAARLEVAHACATRPSTQVADDPIARHVVSENARVARVRRRAARRRRRRRVRAPDAARATRSLRDDFAVSTPELDLLVALGGGTRRVRCPPHRRGLRWLHRRARRLRTMSSASPGGRRASYRCRHRPQPVGVPRARGRRRGAGLDR